MAEENKSFLYGIYEDLTGAVEGLSSGVFLGRPDKTSSEMSSFIVVEIPTRIRNIIAGRVDLMAHCYATYTVYCKAKKDHTMKVGAQTDLVQAVIDRFPINGKYIAATRPQILMEGEDGYGYQATKITFSIRTK